MRVSDCFDTEANTVYELNKVHLDVKTYNLVHDDAMFMETTDTAYPGASVDIPELRCMLLPNAKLEDEMET